MGGFRMPLVAPTIGTLLLTFVGSLLPQGTLAGNRALQDAATQASQTPENPPQHAMEHRAEDVMGFSQTKTTHHFLLTKDGGWIQVTAKDPNDASSQGQIRMHLPHIATAFASGDFMDPMEVHAQMPPGVPTLKRLREQIQYKYEAIDRGGRVLIQTENAEAIRAIHDFLRFQIREHHTSDSLKVK